MTDEFDFGFDDSDTAFGAADTSASDAEARFKEEVNKKIKELASKDAATRRAAAYWLGESGEPKAITALVQAYKQNKDKQLKDASRYALGMFRALEKALSGGDQERDRALILIERIVNEGKLGRRASAGRALLKIEIGLVVSLVVLVLLNVVLSSLKGAGPADGVTATPSSPTIGVDPLQALADLHVLEDQIRTDGLKLQSQLGGIQAGRKLDCATLLINPLPYSLSPEVAAAFPDVAAVAGQINSARTDLVTVKAVFDQGCQPDSQLTAEGVVQPIDTITTMLRSLAGINAQMTTLEPTVQAALTLTPRVTPSVEATGEVTAESTPEPTALPTATPEPSTINPHVVALESIITQMTEQRGANTLLGQYWNDARQFGATEGCRTEVPPVPADYTAIDAATAQAVPQLQQAAELVNLGLLQVRQGWTLFTGACANNTVAAQAAIGLEYTRNAANAFSAATTVLDEVRLSLR